LTTARCAFQWKPLDRETGDDGGQPLAATREILTDSGCIPFDHPQFWELAPEHRGEPRLTLDGNDAIGGQPARTSPRVMLPVPAPSSSTARADRVRHTVRVRRAKRRPLGSQPLSASAFAPKTKKYGLAPRTRDPYVIGPVVILAIVCYSFSSPKCGATVSQNGSSSYVLISDQTRGERALMAIKKQLAPALGRMCSKQP